MKNRKARKFWVKGGRKDWKLVHNFVRNAKSKRAPVRNAARS